MNTSRRILCTAIASLITGAATTLNAADKIWTGAIDQTWSNAANWNPTGTPNLNGVDNVQITGATVNRTTELTVSATTLALTNSTFTSTGISVNNGGIVTLNGGSWNTQNANVTIKSEGSVFNGDFNLGTGEFTVSGDVSIIGGTVSTKLVQMLNTPTEVTHSRVHLKGGRLVVNGASFTGFYPPEGNAHSAINFTRRSPAVFTIANATVENVVARYFNATHPILRFDNTVVPTAERNAVFNIHESVEYSGGVDISLQPLNGLPDFDAPCTADVNGTSVTLTTLLGSAGTPAATLYAFWGETNGGIDPAAWTGRATIGAGADNMNVAFSNFASYPLEPNRTYYYRIAASNSVGMVWATPLPSSFTTAAGNNNYFIGAVSSLASVPQNWSRGIVPNATQDVHFSGELTQNNTLVWDPAAPQQIRSFTQSGANLLTRFQTTPTAPLSILNNATLDAGRWVHDGPAAAPVYALNLVIGGNLIIASGANINAGTGELNLPAGAARGYLAGPGNQPNSGASFGGEGGGSSITYGSILNPCDYGSGGNGDNTYFAGAGFILLSVKGTTTLDGSLLANGFGYTGATSSGASSGGTINLTTGTLLGNGAIRANGGKDDNYGPGSGGRIRVKLTQSAAQFTDFTGTIEALGASFSDLLGLGDRDGSASGTLTLQTAADDAESARILVTANTRRDAATHLPPMQNTDAKLSKTTWHLDDAGTLRLTQNIRVKAIEITQKGANIPRLFLDGHTLTVTDFTCLGAHQPCGTYTAADLPGILIGDGKLIVEFKGTVLIIR